MPNNPGLVMNAGAAAGQIQGMGGDRQRDLLDSNNGNVIRRLLFSNSSNNKLVDSGVIGRLYVGKTDQPFIIMFRNNLPFIYNGVKELHL